MIWHLTLGRSVARPWTRRCSLTLIALNEPIVSVPPLAEEMAGAIKRKVIVW